MKINTFFAAFALFAITSCSKSQQTAVINSSSGETVNIQKITEVENMTRASVGLGYAQLNPTEKVLLWNRHIDSYLKTHIVSKSLKGFVQHLRTELTPDLYRDSPNKTAEEKDEELTSTSMDDALRSGSYNNTDLLAMTTVSGLGTVSPEVSQCTCYYTLYCQSLNGGGQTCVDNDYCKQHGIANCGVFGGSRCTGNCS